MKYKKVGVIGEHPDNDSEAMIALLEKHLRENISLELLDIKNMRGSAMDSPNFARELVDKLIDENFDYLIVLRDLDFLRDKNKTEKQRINDKDKWFTKVYKSMGALDVKGIFFLIIYELEALMLCDLSAVNTFFDLNISFTKKPIDEKNPKEFLQNATQNSVKGRYEEKNAKDIFTALDFQKLYDNHTGKRSFRVFADDLKREAIVNLDLHFAFFKPPQPVCTLR